MNHSTRRGRRTFLAALGATLAGTALPAWAKFQPDQFRIGYQKSATTLLLLKAHGTLEKRLAPLGIKVTIVEPGGFRTDFAGSSTKLSEGNPDYDSTVGATARFQRDYNGKQPGDPKKAAQAIVRLTQEQKPPSRLLLGSDAYNAAEKNDLARLEEARSWKELSLSTDFEAKPPHPERPK